jgi:hypothetical protein
MANLLRHALNHTQRRKEIPRESEFYALGISFSISIARIAGIADRLQAA